MRLSVVNDLKAAAFQRSQDAPQVSFREGLMKRLPEIKLIRGLVAKIADFIGQFCNVHDASLHFREAITTVIVGSGFLFSLKVT